MNTVQQNSTNVVNNMLKDLHSLQNLKVDKFGPILIQVLISLIIDMAKTTDSDLLKQVEAFNPSNDDWISAFLGIYEMLCTTEARYKQKVFSKSIFKFIDFLQRVRNDDSINNQLLLIEKRVQHCIKKPAFTRFSARIGDSSFEKSLEKQSKTTKKILKLIGDGTLTPIQKRDTDQITSQVVDEFKLVPIINRPSRQFNTHQRSQLLPELKHTPILQPIVTNSKDSLSPPLQISTSKHYLKNWENRPFDKPVREIKREVKKIRRDHRSLMTSIYKQDPCQVKPVSTVNHEFLQAQQAQILIKRKRVKQYQQTEPLYTTNQQAAEEKKSQQQQEIQEEKDASKQIELKLRLAISQKVSTTNSGQTSPAHKKQEEDYKLSSVSKSIFNRLSKVASSTDVNKKMNFKFKDPLKVIKKPSLQVSGELQESSEKKLFGDEHMSFMDTDNENKQTGRQNSFKSNINNSPLQKMTSRKMTFRKHHNKSQLSDQSNSKNIIIRKFSSQTQIITGLTHHGVKRSTILDQVILNDFNEAFKFNILGFLNTHRDQAIYRVTAKLNHLRFTFDDVDWKNTTITQFRFQQEDFVVNKKDYTLEEHANIVYIIDKYNPQTKKVEYGHAFAVQPISITSSCGLLQLIVGQYQLPIYEGSPPNQLYQNKCDAKSIIKKQQKLGFNRNIEYTQMVVRLSQQDCEEDYANEWWPFCETKMTFINNLTQYHKLHKYVLHARHRFVVEDESLLLERIWGEDFEKVIQKANKAFDQ